MELSAVLSALPMPTNLAVNGRLHRGAHGFGTIGRVVITATALKIPVTVPVRPGEPSDAFRPSAVCAAALTGLVLSAVLSTLPQPTKTLGIPVTVPANAGLA